MGWAGLGLGWAGAGLLVGWAETLGWAGLARAGLGLGLGLGAGGWG